MKKAVFVAVGVIKPEELLAFYDATEVPVIVEDGVPTIKTSDPVVIDMLNSSDEFYQTE